MNASDLRRCLIDVRKGQLNSYFGVRVDVRQNVSEAMYKQPMARKVCPRMCVVWVADRFEYVSVVNGILCYILVSAAPPKRPCCAYGNSQVTNHSTLVYSYGTSKKIDYIYKCLQCKSQKRHMSPACSRCLQIDDGGLRKSHLLKVLLVILSALSWSIHLSVF